jgi:hypothetical protein
MNARLQYNVIATLTQAVNRAQLVGPGVVTKEDQAKLDELTQNPDRFMSWFSKEANIAALERLKNIVIDQAEVKMRVAGVRRADGSQGWTTTDSSKGRVNAKAIELMKARAGGAKLNPEQEKILAESEAAYKTR